MKFIDILSILNENSEKKLEALNALKNKLGQKWPNISSNDIDKYIEWFEKTKDNFTSDNVAIRNFLYRFDGNHGYEKFQPLKPNNLPIVQNLKNILNYTENQIVSLYKEFSKSTSPEEVEVDDDERVFDEKNRIPTPEKIKASKALWYGDKYKVYDNNGFRIYEIPNQFVSVNFGYYLDTYHSSPYNFSGYQWCTTSWSTKNYYESKRADRYFYFIIDESKHPDIITDKNISKFYLSAFQVFRPEAHREYALTDITNPGELTKTKEELLKIYPKLSNIIDKLKYVPFDEETEMFIRNHIGRINEVPGHKYEYARVPRDQKLRYITNNGTLSTKRSWEHTDKVLRNIYIMTSTRENIIERFSTFEIINSLTTSDITALNNRLKMVIPEKSFKDIKVQSMSSEFIFDERISLLNSNISLYRSRKTKKFGIFNKESGEWLSKNGITYEPYYNRINEDYFMDENNNSYFVETYSINNSEDNNSFYCIYDTDKSFDGYFLSSEQWLKLNEKIEEMSKIDVDFDPDIDTDLKENGEF